MQLSSLRNCETSGDAAIPGARADEPKSVDVTYAMYWHRGSLLESMCDIIQNEEIKITSESNHF